MRTVLTAVVCLGAANVVAAQRAALAGRVVDADGEPVAGWTVHAVGRTVPLAPEIGRLDRLEATTNDAGRFRVSALVGVDYDCWAFGPPRADGAVPATDVAWRLGVGSTVTLREGEPRLGTAIRVVGAGAWEDVGPLSVRAIPWSFAYREVPATPRDDGTYELPPLPGDGAILEVVDARGELLATTHTDLTRPLTRERTADGLRVTKVPVAAPVELPAVVRQADGGAPIAGATVRHLVGSVWFMPSGVPTFQRFGLPRWRVAGRTDAEGRVTLRIPAGEDPRTAKPYRLWLVASKDGFADQHSGWQSQRPFVDGRELEADAEVDELRFDLEKSAGFSKEVRTLEGPLADLPVLVRTTSKIVSDSGWHHLARRWVTATDGEGRIHLPALPADTWQLELVAELPAAVRERVRADDPRTGPLPVFTSWNAGEFTLDGEPVPAWEIAGARTVAIQVLDADGGPVRDARALAVPLKEGVRGVPQLPLETRLDPVGRVALRLPAERHVVIVLSPRGWVTAVLEAGAETAELQLELGAFDTVEVVVRDADGPVQGATVDVVGSSITMGDAGESGGMVDAVFSNLNTTLLERGRTAADGTLTLRYVARPNLDYVILARHGERKSERVEIDSDAGDAPIVFELR